MNPSTPADLNKDESAAADSLLSMVTSPIPETETQQIIRTPRPQPAPSRFSILEELAVYAQEEDSGNASEGMLHSICSCKLVIC